ncbi:uncharacterized protein V6R79_012249 [Siganus canaliculatus]
MTGSWSRRHQSRAAVQVCEKGKMWGQRMTLLTGCLQSRRAASLRHVIRNAKVDMAAAEDDIKEATLNSSSFNRVIVTSILSVTEQMRSFVNGAWFDSERFACSHLFIHAVWKQNLMVKPVFVLALQHNLRPKAAATSSPSNRTPPPPPPPPLPLLFVPPLALGEEWGERVGERKIDVVAVTSDLFREE